MMRKAHVQQVLDVLGYANNVPIRILNNSVLNELDYSDISCSEILGAGSGPADLDRILKCISDYGKDSINNTSHPFLEDRFREPTLEFENLPKPFQALAATNLSSYESLEFVVRTIDDIEQKIWINLGSNPLPIENMFRLSPEWRWYCLGWLIPVSYTHLTLPTKA